MALSLERRLLARGTRVSVVDGDVLRAGPCRDLGFTAVDRRENIRRAGELAVSLANAGTFVIVALISPFRADRDAVAQRIRDESIPFAEVFINAPLEECELRDPKSLYKRARAGEIKLFTGIDSPYERPDSPALELRTNLETVDESSEKLLQFALTLEGARPNCEHRPLRGGSA